MMPPAKRRLQHSHTTRLDESAGLWISPFLRSGRSTILSGRLTPRSGSMTADPLADTRIECLFHDTPGGILIASCEVVDGCYT